MPRSEIDDIFASKGKQERSQLPSSTSNLSEEPKKKKKNLKKRKREADSEVTEGMQEKSSEKPPTKRKIPETVLDPSVRIAAASKVEKSGRSSDVKKKREKVDKEKEARFKDSRGTGPRRKTDEGFLIYKEDELGITETGGDTPLCPFDCQCCF